LARGKVGDAVALLFKAEDLWALHRHQLAKVCPTCKVRPNRNWKS
jgi:hypothetical protein